MSDASPEGIMCSKPAGRKKPAASHARMSAIFQDHGSSGICEMPPMLSSRENGSSHLRAARAPCCARQRRRPRKPSFRRIA